MLPITLSPPEASALSHAAVLEPGRSADAALARSVLAASLHHLAEEDWSEVLDRAAADYDTACAVIRQLAILASEAIVRGGMARGVSSNVALAEVFDPDSPISGKAATAPGLDEWGSFGALDGLKDGLAAREEAEETRKRTPSK
jgi:hypothetical protein